MDIQFKQTLKTFLVLFGVLLFGMLLGVSLADLGYMPVGQENRDSVLEEQEGIRVDLAIDYGNGEVQSFPAEVVRQGDTALKLLEKLEQSKGIIVEKRNFPGLGTFIEAIHGVHNTNNSYWQFWVNGEYAQVGAGEYALKDGDKVLWKRTSERPE